jgi:hypothetical protein
VNVVFSNQCVDDFFSVNDGMSRRDHETKKNPKSFWITATLAHNSCIESDVDVVHIPKGAPTATPEGCATSSSPNHNNLSTLSDKTAEDNDEASDTVGAIEFDNHDPFSLFLMRMMILTL